MKNRDMALLWWSKRPLSNVSRDGGICIYGEPKNLRCPDGKVMLVNKQAQVVLEFIVASKEPKPFRMNNGEFQNGCFVRARKGSVRLIRNGPKLRGNWYWEGSHRYVRPGTNHVTIETSSTGGIAPVASHGKGRAPHRKSGQIQRMKFRGVIQGLQRDHPEARLVREYVRYIGDADKDRFQCHQYRPGNFRCDLYDARQSRLIEAKIDVSRESLRMAFGQLCDYRRFYKRRRHKHRPRLAVLLSEKPDNNSIRFLTIYKTLVIWRVRGHKSKFTDSNGGRWTRGIRVSPRSTT